jgi:hypothetical protein
MTIAISVIFIVREHYFTSSYILLQDTYIQPPPAYPYPIVISGIVFQCAPYLEAVFQNIMKITTLFSDYRIVIEIDEGKDASLSILETWKEKLTPRMILVQGKKSSNIRTENIAIARNAAHNEIQEIIQKSSTSSSPFEPKFFIVLDMDNVCIAPIKLPVLRHALDNEHVWDSVSFHRKPYYDIWALSFDPYFMSCFHWKKNQVAFIKEKITQKLDTIPSNKFLPVLSAFNGFAVYRTNIFMRCVYDWRFQSTQKFLTPAMLSRNKQAMQPNEFKRTMEMDCEHRFFHMSAVFDHSARIQICPQLLF